MGILAIHVYKTLTSESQYIARMKSVTFDKHIKFLTKLLFQVSFSAHWYALS